MYCVVYLFVYLYLKIKSGITLSCIEPRCRVFFGMEEVTVTDVLNLNLPVNHCKQKTILSGDDLSVNISNHNILLYIYYIRFILLLLICFSVTSNTIDRNIFYQKLIAYFVYILGSSY